MAKELNIPYLGDACWSEFHVGKQIYTAYTLHGRTGAQRSGTVMTALENISSSFDADLIAMGHAHRCIDSFDLIQYKKGSNIVPYPQGSKLLTS